MEAVFKANIVSVFPFFEKDSKGLKTNKVKGFGINVIETKQDRNSKQLIFKSDTYFTDFELDPELLNSLSSVIFPLVDITVEIENLNDKPKISDIQISDAVGAEVVFNCGKQFK